jgi:hypothetical protein
MNDVTRPFEALRIDCAAGDEALPLVYTQLRRIACFAFVSSLVRLIFVLVSVYQPVIAAQSPEAILTDSLHNGSSPFSVAGWEDAMRSRLTELAVGARHRPFAEIQKLSENIVNSNPNAPNLERDIATFKAESSEIDRANQSAYQFGVVCKQLQRLRDPRVVGLVAPFLDEETESFNHGDYTVRAPQNRAAEVLSNLAAEKLIDAPVIDEFNLERWRSWWNSKKESAAFSDHSSIQSPKLPASSITSVAPNDSSAADKRLMPGAHQTFRLTLALVAILLVAACFLTWFIRRHAS